VVGVISPGERIDVIAGEKAFPKKKKMGPPERKTNNTRGLLGKEGRPPPA